MFVEKIFLNRICLAGKYYIPAYQRLIPCSGKNTIHYNLCFTTILEQKNKDKKEGVLNYTATRTSYYSENIYLLFYPSSSFSGVMTLCIERKLRPEKIAIILIKRVGILGTEHTQTRTHPPTYTHTHTHKGYLTK